MDRMPGGDGWFDTHTHLSDEKFDADRSAAVDRAFAGGVTALVEIADGPSEWPKARDLAEKYPNRIWWAGGLHPYFAEASTPDLWKSLKTIAQHPQFVAVGEIGLDYAKCPIPPDRQQAAFEAGIILGQEIIKPLIIHCRNAFGDLIPILHQYFSSPKKDGENSPGVIHCFSGNGAEARALLELGFYLGVDGPITYPNSQSLREALAGLPIEKLVLETDSPYLPPQTHRGQRNEPSLLPTIGGHLATLLGKAPDQVARALNSNSRRLFRLKQAD